MTERPHPPAENEREPCWHLDIAIGAGSIDGERPTLRLQVHAAVETYTRHQELVPLRAQAGHARRCAGRPYILEPMLTLTINSSAQPAPDGSIGTVESAAWEGLRHRDIGNANLGAQTDTNTKIQARNKE